jgi:hypothetical protein
VDPVLVQESHHHRGEGTGPPVFSLDDRADFLADVAQVVDARVTALGRRLEEEQEKRLEFLLNEIDIRLDELARRASRKAQPKPAKRLSRADNGAVGGPAPAPESDQPGPPRPSTAG